MYFFISFCFVFGCYFIFYFLVFGEGFGYLEDERRFLKMFLGNRNLYVENVKCEILIKRFYLNFTRN